MIESALAMMVFALFVAGIMELGLTGFASNTLNFAAERAVRWAAVRGTASGHAATSDDVKAIALEYVAPLNSANTSITVTWTPDKSVGSTVQVVVAYTFSGLRPLAAGALKFQSTARQTITQ